MPTPRTDPEHASGAADDKLEARIQKIGREIFAGSQTATPAPLGGDWWQQRILEWTMHDARLRTQLFRFVDVLPSLRTGREVAEHLAEYLDEARDSLPAPMEPLLRFPSSRTLAARIAAIAARRDVRGMARRFIAGETAEEALATVQRLRQERMTFTLDVLGEAVTSDSQADAYMRRYLELIDVLSRAAEGWSVVEPIDAGPDGPAPRVNVSLKLSALDSRFDPIAPQSVAAAVGARLRPILRAARDRGAFVHVDMEEYEHKDLVLYIFKGLLMEDEFRELSRVGVVLQAYLLDAAKDMAELVDWVRRRGHPITVRLVKGAYWDTETVLAAQRRWPCPVHAQKSETDAAFERLTRTLIDNHELLYPAFASHNVRSIANAIALAERAGLSPRDFEIQMLFGMGEPLEAALVRRGLKLRIYAPYGPLIPGMAYLIRRLLENTSNDSFLRQSLTEHAPVEELLAVPAPRPAEGDLRAGAVPEPGGGTPPLSNEPLTDFSLASNRTAMAEALREVRQQCGATYPLAIGGEVIATETVIDSIDPSHPATVVGHVASASTEHADRAVAAAQSAWSEWQHAGVDARAGLLRRLGERMRSRRFELAAWAVIETGKPWREADADVAEAIDYCDFYAGEVERLQRQPRERSVPGERNTLVYEPRGVAAVIAPWNFPLAILTGMTTAALVTGNTVVVKPAEQSPVMAAKLFEMLAEAGMPPGVAAFLPGVGEEVGAHLVGHPDVAVIAFTGSRAVGLQIVERAAHVGPGQRFVKRVIAEMGGKNAIIVDADADLDDAVKGVTASAFGYAGQKCSACSRVIVLESVHDLFLERLVETTRSLAVGAADDPATVVGPLIDDEARDRVVAYIELGKKEAALACEVEIGDRDGYCIGPVVFDRVPRGAAIAQEEIFGPVLSVLVARSFDEALEIANDVDYGLTGGIYSRRPRHIERAKRELRVGNLYVNRSITGAVVDRQPFGGVKLSGVGSKAGGPDYLLQFCEPKTVAENTMRHGFTPQNSD